MDVQRVLPAQDANEVATQQIEALLGRLEEGEAVSMFVFDIAAITQKPVEIKPCMLVSLPEVRRLGNLKGCVRLAAHILIRVVHPHPLSLHEPTSANVSRSKDEQGRYWYLPCSLDKLYEVRP